MKDVRQIINIGDSVGVTFRKKKFQKMGLKVGDDVSINISKVTEQEASP